MTEYIEREEAIKIIDRIFDLTDPTGDEQIGVLKCRNAIREKIPAADVAEVRRGKWIDLHNEDALYEQTYKCSVCGEWLVFETGTPKENECNYCPNCGAKMGDDEE